MRALGPLLLACLLAGCGTATTTAGVATTAPSRSTTTSTPASRTVAIVTEHLDLVDGSRPVTSGGATIAGVRSLPTTVVRPDDGVRHPLVLLLPGFGVGPPTYARMLAWLARHGVVAAAPSFPLADPAQGHVLDRADIPTEATDVAFVLRSLRHGATGAHLAPGRTVVLGHSDGADVALLVGYDAALRVPSVSAVVAVAPDPIDRPVISGGPPLLLLHGSADQVVPPASSAAVMATVSAARWSVTLDGADHASAIIGPSPWTAALDHAVGHFLAATVGGRGASTLSGALARLPGAEVVSAPGP